MSNGRIGRRSIEGRKSSTKKFTLLPHPPRSRKALPASPATRSPTLERLHTNVDLLDKIFIRNKNQHRAQLWFKQLSILRRSLRRLLKVCEDLEKLNVGPGTSDAGVARTRFENETRLRAEKQVWQEWLQEVSVPQAYVAFSNLVADTQFAQVGVVLVAALSDGAALVGMPTSQHDASVKKSSKAEVGEVVARRVVVTGFEKGESLEEVYRLEDQNGHGMDVDMGEVVQRDSLAAAEEDEVDKDVTQATAVEQQVESTFTATTASTSSMTVKRSTLREAGTKPTKRRKGKKNAIDQIFAGF